MEQQSFTHHFCWVNELDCSLGGRSQTNQLFQLKENKVFFSLGWFGLAGRPVRHWNCRYYSSICLAPQGEKTSLSFIIQQWQTPLRFVFFFIGSLSSLFHQSTVQADDWMKRESERSCSAARSKLFQSNHSFHIPLKRSLMEGEAVLLLFSLTAFQPAERKGFDWWRLKKAASCPFNPIKLLFFSAGWKAGCGRQREKNKVNCWVGCSSCLSFLCGALASGP